MKEDGTEDEQTSCGCFSLSASVIMCTCTGKPDALDIEWYIEREYLGMGACRIFCRWQGANLGTIVPTFVLLRVDNNPTVVKKLESSLATLIIHHPCTLSFQT